MEASLLCLARVWLAAFPRLNLFFNARLDDGERRRIVLSQCDASICNSSCLQSSLSQVVRAASRFMGLRPRPVRREGVGIAWMPLDL